MARGTEWTQQDEQALVKLVLDGLSASKIGAQLGRTKNAVIGQCRRQGLKLAGGGYKMAPVVVERKRHWQPEQIDTIRQMGADGLSMRQVGEKLGISCQAVAGICHRNKIRFAPTPAPAPQKRGPKRGQPCVARIRERQAAKPVLVARPTPIEAPTGTAKDLLSLEPSDCRYPVVDGLFCADARQDLSSYCAHHHAVCWRPAPEQRRIGTMRRAA